MMAIASRKPLAQLAPETIEQIAQRVAQLILECSRRDTDPRLIDAAELARRTGVSRAWIYEHADYLGAIRIGAGPKPRLRFDPDAVATVLLEPATQNRKRAAAPRQQQRSRSGADRNDQSNVELLPIRRPSRPRSMMSRSAAPRRIPQR